VASEEAGKMKYSVWLSGDFTGSVLSPPSPPDEGLVRDSDMGQAQRNQRGLNGISGHQKRLLKSACVLLENKYGKNCLSFGTATLPYGSGEEHRLCCENWDEICRQFFQEVKRLMQRRGLNPNAWAYCVEIQDERWQKRGEFCPHIHWLMQGRTPGQHWAINKNEFREIWERVLCNVTGQAMECPTATRIESVRKSAAGYMAKYLSKGGQALADMREEISLALIPRSWMGCSARLRKAVMAQTYTSSRNIGAFIDYVERLVEKGLATFHWIEIKLLDAEKPLRVGFVGRIFDRNKFMNEWQPPPFPAHKPG